ncbi:MAG: DUF2855 family protein [Pseudomonadota bacterium]
MVVVLETLKTDILDARATDRAGLPLAPGQARMRVDRVALTANTVTYAVVGARIGYWRFWPCEATDEGRGLVPAWGFATCVESRSDHVAAGERFYGCWALAEELAVDARPAPDGFIDAAPRREGLAPFYARYHRAPFGEAEAEARRALLQPLAMTGWLLTDYIEAHDRFGAERAILSSASSKTSIALAQALKEAGIPALGLTSAGNEAFVRGLGSYREVDLYDALPDALDRVPSVFVDMAGSEKVRRAVHEALSGGLLKASIGVGAARWRELGAAPDIPDPQPEFFFAPAWAQKRTEDWGGPDFARRLNEAADRRVEASRDWLTVDVRGVAELEAAWAEAAAGRQAPASGVVIAFR